jgi:hypothetical protein
MNVHTCASHARHGRNQQQQKYYCIALYLIVIYQVKSIKVPCKLKSYDEMQFLKNSDSDWRLMKLEKIKGFLLQFA